MELIELFLIAFALSMDAFAVSVAKGLSVARIKPIHTIKVGLWFGAFQGIMPIFGYLLTEEFSDILTSVDHWIVFFLLSGIGLNMIKESIDQKRHKKKSKEKEDFSCKTMLLLAIATSIDAMAIGISFAILKVNILSSALIIAITTCTLSAIGIHIGWRFGCRFKSKAEWAGGIILILIGIHILIEHTMMGV